MKFASTAELKNRTNDLLHEIEAGQVVVVTRHGKPVAAIQVCHEDDLEDLILETNRAIRASVRRAELDIVESRGISLDRYRAPPRSRSSRRR